MQDPLLDYLFFGVDGLGYMQVLYKATISAEGYFKVGYRINPLHTNQDKNSDYRLPATLGNSFDVNAIPNVFKPIMYSFATPLRLIAKSGIILFRIWSQE